MKKQIQNAVALSQAALKKADDVIADSKKFLKQLDEDLERIEEANEKVQTAIDKKIVNIVQEMDEATLQFIKDTE